MTVEVTADPSAPAAVQAEMIRQGKVSSESLVSEAIRRAHSITELNAFVTINENGALADARKADERLRSDGAQSCPPLHGVPIVVKDNIHAAGIPSSAATPALKGFVPQLDAGVVKKLRDAGAIVIGMTNMHELALGISGYNPTHQTGPYVGVRNAYDVRRSAGGSSSGTGAAVGARVVGAGLGTDTGGSVRIPGAFNGCAALRPSLQRYPQDGIVPLCRSRDTAGPMALAMRDIELLDRIITDAPSEAQPAELGSVRLGLAKEFLANMDADTAEAFELALAKLKTAGVVLVDVEMSGVDGLNAATGLPVLIWEAHDDLVGHLSEHHPDLSIAEVTGLMASPDVKEMYESYILTRKMPNPSGGPALEAKPLHDAAVATARPALRALYSQTFEKYKLDALVFPTVPRVAMAANAEASSLANLGAVIQNTDPGSNAGIPGLQLPIALGSRTGMPVGLELDGPHGSDRRLVSIGLALEELFGQLPPPRCCPQRAA